MSRDDALLAEIEQDLQTSSAVIHLLKAQPHLLPKRNVLAAYQREVAEFGEATLDEQHARLDGKWLVEVLAPGVTHQSPEQCRAEWIQEAAHRGGDPEVRALWARAIL